MPISSWRMPRHGGGKLGQLDALEAMNEGFAGPGGNLLDGVFRLVKIEQGAESLRLFDRVNVAALQVLDQLRFKGLGIGQMNDADRHGLGLGNERGAVAARSGNDLEAMVGDRPNEQGRQYALAADVSRPVP